MLNDRDYMNNRSGRNPSVSSTSIVTTLIWVNVGVFILQQLSGGGLIPLLALRGPDIQSLQLWRFGTYMFAHGGFLHILINMWILYIMGKPVESRIGGNDFLYLYFVSGLIGAFFWLIFNWGSTVPVIGASGAVFGVMMAAAMLYPNLQIMLLFPPIPMKLKTFVGVFGGIQVLLALQMGGGQEGGGIAYLAHLGGLLGGFLYMWRYNRKHRPNYSMFDAIRRQWGGNRGAPGRSRRAAFKKHQGFKRREAVGKDEDEFSEDDLDLSSENVDCILDKIGTHGIQNLSKRERKVLELARKRLHEKRKGR